MDTNTIVAAPWLSSPSHPTQARELREIQEQERLEEARQAKHREAARAELLKQQSEAAAQKRAPWAQGVPSVWNVSQPPKAAPILPAATSTAAGKRSAAAVAAVNSSMPTPAGAAATKAAKSTASSKAMGGLTSVVKTQVRAGGRRMSGGQCRRHVLAADGQSDACRRVHALAQEAHPTTQLVARPRGACHIPSGHRIAA